MNRTLMHMASCANAAHIRVDLGLKMCWANFAQICIVYSTLLVLNVDLDLDKYHAMVLH